MALDNFLANSKTYASSWILRLTVQPLEHLEHLVGITGGEADAVVAHGEYPLFVSRLGRHLHAQRLLAAELDCIGQQVGEHLLELARVRLDHRQRAADHADPVLGDRRLEGREHLVHQRRAVDRLKLRRRADP